MAAPDNNLMKDVHTLVDQVVEETDQASGFSKSIPTFAFGDVDGQRYDDVEYLPEDFRFEAKDGYISLENNSDAQALTDRMIPIRRSKALYIKTAIKTKELRDPRLRTMAVKGFAREIRNKVDTYCYRKAITHANMVIKSSEEIAQSDASAAEVLMLDAGLGGYASNLHMSLPHYKTLSDKLALNQFHGGLPQTAYERSIIPNQVGGFDKAVRADYRLTLKKQTKTGLAVRGNQSHTVQTKDGNDNYIDNRSMNLTITATADLKVGDKFTIEDVYRLNPEVREDTGELMTFTVMGINANNATDMTISPAIVIAGPYRNCSVQAGNGKAITFLNIADNNPSVFWASDSIKLIPGNLPVEGGGVNKVDAVTDQGLPMRFTYWYDPDLETMLMKVVIFFDMEVWLPSQVGVILDKQKT